MNGLSWADYIAGRPDRLPPGGPPWEGVPWAEWRRVHRNYARWKRRRLEAMREPIEFRIVGDRVEVFGRRRRLGLG